MAKGHTQDDVLGAFFALNVETLRWALIWAHLLVHDAPSCEGTVPLAHAARSTPPSSCPTQSVALGPCERPKNKVALQRTC